MNENIVAVVFNNRSQAEEGIEDLRRAGVGNDAISIIARHDGDTTTTDGAGDDIADKAADAGKGALAGGALGVIAGIAALAIPGVGPLVGAGAIAASAVPGAAAAGAAVGAAGGGLVGLLSDHGVDENDARYFESRINTGGVFVSVDTRSAGLSSHEVRDILERNGGHRSEGSSYGSGAGMSSSTTI